MRTSPVDSTLNVLLLRPDPVNERFGLGPFFRVEPLGLEYLAASVRHLGARCAIADLRFGPSLASWLRRTRPRAVGISCTHALEYDEVVATARAVRQLAPATFIVVGGHAAASFPAPLDDPSIDAICSAEGELVFPALLEALSGRRRLGSVPGLLLREGGDWRPTGPPEQALSLDAVPLPARELCDHQRHGYLCLNYQPIWLLETARGCPYRCTFCSVWQLYGRRVRERSIGAVVEDFAAVGPHVFVADDMFWHPPERSLELARALRQRGIHKRWLLVQARNDTVAEHAELLAEWRPLADRIDIFFGFESPSDAELTALDKDSDVSRTVAGIQAARDAGYGVTGNFLIDPDWDVEDFERLWAFVATHKLRRAGYTVLTPLPGTAYFEQVRERVRGQPWFKYDMHHLLWEPRLGKQRFFELFAETWRRSVLNVRGEKKVWEWLRQIEPRHVPRLLHVLWRTQRLMDPAAYWREERSAPVSPRGPR